MLTIVPFTADVSWNEGRATNENWDNGTDTGAFTNGEAGYAAEDIGVTDVEAGGGGGGDFKCRK